MKKVFVFSLVFTFFLLSSLLSPRVTKAQNCTANTSDGAPCACLCGDDTHPTNDTCSGYWSNCSGGCTCTPNESTEGNAVNWNSLFGAIQHEPDPAIDMRSATLGSLTNRLIPYIFAIAGFLLLIYLIIGGFSYMTSGGNPKTMAAAQQKITYAVLGFVIIFLAYWIVIIVGRILNIPQSRFPFQL